MRKKANITGVTELNCHCTVDIEEWIRSYYILDTIADRAGGKIYKSITYTFFPAEI